MANLRDLRPNGPGHAAVLITANAALPASGGAMTGDIDFNDNVIQEACIVDYAEKTQAAAANDIDLSPLRYRSKLGYNRHNQRNGHINFRYRFGNGSNINIHKGW